MRDALLELYAFMGAFYGGLVIGALYDVFSLLRLPFRHMIVDGIVDMLFYVAAGVIAALTMLAVNGGEIRMYVFISIIMGGLTYRYTVGTLISALIGRIFPQRTSIGK